MTQDRGIEPESGLRGKRIVLLGGSSGIGLAVAQQVTERGAEVVIVSSNAQRNQEAVKTLGGKAEGRILDLTDEPGIRLSSTRSKPSITWFSRLATRFT